MDNIHVGPKKVLRNPALRRGREIIPISDRVKLEKVLGLTVSNNAAFDYDSNFNIVAYPAGCVVVFYDIRKNKQSHILSSSKKTITSLAFSADGKYLATGECGHQPHVRVWDTQEKIQVAEFQGHKYGINCVAFSPNLKYVVSVGSQYDMIVNVWDWKSNIKVASNKVSCKVKALSFASNGNYFVTVGNRHVKFWYLECSRSAKYKHEAVPLMGRSAILGDQRNNYFCDVACGIGDMVESTYAITKSGLLCEFNSRRYLDKWVELRTVNANSISVSDNLIVVGCSEGIIRCFNPSSLTFVTTLPKPHILGIDVAAKVQQNKCAKYPDTIAISLDERNRKITCIYNDHSLYVWDIRDVKKVGKSHSFMYHSACIWGIEMCPDGTAIPKGTFLTCSSDDTIRIWNLESSMESADVYHRNIYSSELLKIIYVDPELSYLCDNNLNSGSGGNDKGDNTYDGKNGVRCLRISPDGKSLASGDRSGNIRIHDLELIDEQCKIEAHDSEVLCLEYSKPIVISGEEKRYLASASRDRFMHVFDVNQDYSFQQTLDDHSSSITAVRFVQNEDAFQMISCGADKSIIFRKSNYNPQLSLVRDHHVVGKTTLYDMEVDFRQKQILTACQDRNIRVYSVLNGKHVRCFRGSQGEDGSLIKVVLDSSGTYLATSCTDKSLYLYDYATGECLATMFGHSEIVTGLKFTNDGKHLISVSGDGCIFLWKLPFEVTQTMLNKQLSNEGSALPNLWQEGRKASVAVAKPFQLSDTNGDKDSDLVNHNAEAQPSLDAMRFSTGPLPRWAKRQLLGKLPSTDNPDISPPVPPRGKWAQRGDGHGLVAHALFNEDSINIPDNEPQNGTKNSWRGDFKRSYTSEFFQSDDQCLMEILNDADSQVNGKQPSSLPNMIQRSNQAAVMKMEELDAEDERSDSEISEMLFYPASEDGSDVMDVSYHVCDNNDAKERTVQSKKLRVDKLTSDGQIVNISLASHDPEETNSDDEDYSASADNDRLFLGSLCVSTENLERLGQREKFMKSNYESLETEETGAANIKFRRQSLSAKFLANNISLKRTVNGPRSESPKFFKIPERQMVTPTRKREEMMKALSDAKKKLENVGYRSGLSTSKSIADLHSTPDREIFKMPQSKSPGDIRKAASMTNLSINMYNKCQLAPTKDDVPSSASLWSQTKVAYPVENPELVLDPDSSKLTAPHQETIPRTEPVSRSSSSSSLYAKNLNSSFNNSLYKTSSVYGLDRASPHRALSLCRNSPSPSSLPSIVATPKRIVANSAIVALTDSSSDSSPSETTSVFKNGGRPLVPPKTFLGRKRHSSITEDMEVTADNNGVCNGLQKLKSRSEWDLKNSHLLDDTVNNNSSQSNCYLSYSPRKNYMKPLNKNFLALHSTSRSLLMDPTSFFTFDPSSIPITTDLCESIVEFSNRASSCARQLLERISVSPDLSDIEKSSMSNILMPALQTASMDTTALLEQYSDRLVSILEKKMASHDKTK